MFGCSDPNSDERSDNPLIGKWYEAFSWVNTLDCVTFEGETDCPEIQESSTIEFSENSFEVKILPPNRTFIVEEDTLYVGWSGDTMYSGTYEIIKDTIVFNIEDENHPRKMRYWWQNDSLGLANISGRELVVMDGDTSYLATFTMASFVWGNAWMKTFGVFERIE